MQNSQNNSSKKILWIVFFTIFLDLFGVGILIPVFPMLILPGSIFKITPDTWTVGQGFIMSGWLMAMYPLAQFFTSPMLGALSDKYGRKRILCISLLGTIFSYLLFAYAISIKNIPLLFIARIFDGISGANISAAQAIIGDVSNDKNRARNFGMVGVSIGVGFVLGPFFGGRLSDATFVSWFGATTPFYFCALLSILNLWFVVRFLPETLQNKVTHKIKLLSSLNNVFKIFKLSDLTVPILSNFLFNAGFALFSTFFGLILAYHYGYTQAKIGDFFAYLGVTIILAQGLVVGRLSGRVADHQVLKISFFLVGLSIFAYYLVPQDKSYLIYYITPFLSVFVALTRSFNMSLLSKIANSNTRGEIMGINFSFTALAQSIPAIMSGYIANIHIMAIIIFGAVLVVLGGIYFNTNILRTIRL